MAIIDKITNIANAIREKTKTTEKITLEQMPEMISSIKGNGEEYEEFVNFYDYDGTLIHQYPLNEFSKLNSLPILPDSVEGCTCTNWNYDLETIKNMNCHVNVAAIYKKNDVEETDIVEETEPFYVDGTKLYFHFSREMTINFYYRQSIANGIVINWGDGETSLSSSAYGTSNLNLTHTYQQGDYVMSFDLVDGCTLSLGWNGYSYSVLGGSSINSTYAPMSLALYKAEIDLRNTVPVAYAFNCCLGLKDVIFGNGDNCSLQSYLFLYCYALENVQLSTSVTAIGAYAFYRCYRLREIILPNTIKTIGSYAFQYCYRLREIVIPGSVESITDYAFQYCYNLKKVKIENGVTSLGQQTFVGCTQLREVDMPNSIKTIGASCFQECQSLKYIVLPSSLTITNNSTFCRCYALQTVIIPEGVTTIPSETFYQCYSLKFVGFPTSMNTIGQSSFQNCETLRNISFADGLKTINIKAFYQCYNLEYIIIPQSVTTAGSQAFFQIKVLKNIVYPDNLINQSGFIVDCYQSNKRDQTLCEKALEKLSTINSVNSYCFNYSKYLENISIPATITTIGSYAFSNAYALNSISFLDGLISISSYSFDNNGLLKNINLPNTIKTIGSYAFQYCRNIENITVPKNVNGDTVTLDLYSFYYNYNLSQAVLGGNKLNINNCAFNYCRNLEHLLFDEDVQEVTIGQNCLSYTGIESTEDIENIDKINITGSGVFSSCLNLEKTNCENMNFISQNYLDNMFNSSYALADVNIGINNNITRIGSGMFYNCYCLTKIELNENIQTINSQAFYQCYNLKEVINLGNSLYSIGSNVFDYCYSLEKISIPYTVTNMNSCFNYCYGLYEIYMYPTTPPTGTTSIGGNLANNYKIYVPKGCQNAYETQWTSHVGHFEEFKYFEFVKENFSKRVVLSSNRVEIYNCFFCSLFENTDNVELTIESSSKNIAITNLSIDYNEKIITIDFSRNEDFEYNITDDFVINVNIENIQYSDSLNVQLYYLDKDYTVDDYKNTIEGMTLVSYANDDGYTSLSIDSGKVGFTYNNQSLTTLYISGNTWFGFNSSSEHIKVNRRDTYIKCYYYQYIEDIGLKLRWEGYSPYKSRDENHLYVWELFLLNNGDATINLVSKGTSCAWDGTSSFFNNAFSLINEGDVVSFYRQNDTGATYKVVYDDYI